MVDITITYTNIVLCYSHYLGMQVHELEPATLSSKLSSKSKYNGFDTDDSPRIARFYYSNNLTYNFNSNCPLRVVLTS